MSKSDPSDQSRINMTDSADEIAQKIRKAKTDPNDLPSSPDGLEGRPEAANLMGIYAALAEIPVADVCTRFGGGGFSTFKQELAELAVAKLSPIQDEMRRLMKDPAHIEGVLREGGEKARAIAVPVLMQIQDIVGLLRP